jgi:hypothetical protein
MEIAVQASQGMFVYELRLPLSSVQHLPFKFDVRTGQTIGIGMEIPEVDMREARRSMEEGGMGGRAGRGGKGGRTGGGMGGGMSGRPGGGRGSYDPDSLKGKKIWFKVHLASDLPS